MSINIVQTVEQINTYVTKKDVNNCIVKLVL